MQDACAAALTQWPAAASRTIRGRGWSVWPGTRPPTGCAGKAAARKKEAAAVRGLGGRRTGEVAAPRGAGTGRATSDAHLAVLGRHPALDPAVRVAADPALGLRAAHRGDRRHVPGPGADHGSAAGPSETQDPAGGHLAGPSPAAERAARLGGVLRVVYLVFTAGHKPSAGDALVRATCVTRRSGWPGRWPYWPPGRPR